MDCCYALGAVTDRAVLSFLELLISQNVGQFSTVASPNGEIKDRRIATTNLYLTQYSTHNESHGYSNLKQVCRSALILRQQDDVSRLNIDVIFFSQCLLGKMCFSNESSGVSNTALATTARSIDAVMVAMNRFA